MHQNTSTTNFPWKKRGCRLWSCYHHTVSPILALYRPTPIITDLNSDGSTGKEPAVTSDDCDIECWWKILSLFRPVIHDSTPLPDARNFPRLSLSAPHLSVHLQSCATGIDSSSIVLHKHMPAVLCPGISECT